MFKKGTAYALCLNLYDTHTMPYEIKSGQFKLSVDHVYPDESTAVYKDLLDFLESFSDSSGSVFAYSSGSTGIPKKIELKKEHMMQSALMTCSYLNIPKGQTSLLCMPLRFIGAKMVVVRALAYNLSLVVSEPSSNPLSELSEPPYFAAMTPHQVALSLLRSHDREILFGIKVLIIGGGAVDDSLLAELSGSKNRIYSTYGMTETLSHIALRELNPHCSDVYTPFEGVELLQSEDSTLVISCDRIGVKRLKTNDIVKIYPDGTFKVEGRLDNVVNSGGIKIQIESCEKILRDVIKGDFNLSKVPDSVLGEKLVLLYVQEQGDLNDFYKKVHDALPKYHCPKICFKVDSLPRTLSGKPDRKSLKELSQSLLNIH